VSIYLCVCLCLNKMGTDDDAIDLNTRHFTLLLLYIVEGLYYIGTYIYIYLYVYIIRERKVPH